MNHQRETVLNNLRNPGIVPVFFHEDSDYCKEILAACYEAGIRTFEFTNRGKEAYPVFAELVAHRDDKFPNMSMGIGSIVEPYTASLFLATGADFIVSPILNPEIARLCNRRKTLWIPGCGTLTEISNAEEYGASIVKLFPGQQYGPGFVKAIKGPSPRSEIMPTGGIDLSETLMKEWFDAGISCFGIGSALFGKKSDRKSPDKIQKELEQAIAFINTL
ncbi:MAG: bifunctional 4-hydroxy-2-oxoglutarate aldolase/2-dehydro-3-deoxy-phosphogluconate aldolase [Bacteroidota bacterium]